MQPLILCCWHCNNKICIHSVTIFHVWHVCCCPCWQGLRISYRECQLVDGSWQESHRIEAITGSHLESGIQEGSIAGPVGVGEGGVCACDRHACGRIMHVSVSSYLIREHTRMRLHTPMVKVSFLYNYEWCHTITTGMPPFIVVLLQCVSWCPRCFEDVENASHCSLHLFLWKRGGTEIAFWILRSWQPVASV